ncbi:MAG: copper chaperone PCu(A)C [Burkholderiaceae bacterium]|nr:copper chaperone PCu(A)C [Burkholderiaceae bacterium]
MHMKKRNAARVLFSALWLAAAAVAAQTQQVVVKDAWARATVAQQKATGVFMQLAASQDARLLSGASPVAAAVEIHEMTMNGDVMKMRALPDGLALPAGKTVELKPGGLHIMLIDLKQQIQPGDVVPLTLVIETRDGQRETLQVHAPARALNAGAAHTQGAAGKTTQTPANKPH